MTTFHTERKAKKIHTEFFECGECNTIHDTYQDLHHPSSTHGGVCAHCKSEDIKTFSLYTVYHEVYAHNEVDAIETAQDLDEWKVVPFSIKLGELT